MALVSESLLGGTSGNLRAREREGKRRGKSRHFLFLFFSRDSLCCLLALFWLIYRPLSLFLFLSLPSSPNRLLSSQTSLIYLIIFHSQTHLPCTLTPNTSCIFSFWRRFLRQTCIVSGAPTHRIAVCNCITFPQIVAGDVRSGG